MAVWQTSHTHSVYSRASQRPRERDWRRRLARERNYSTRVIPRVFVISPSDEYKRLSSLPASDWPQTIPSNVDSSMD